MVVEGVKVRRPLEILTRDELDTIDFSTIYILEKVGILIDEPEILKILDDAGAIVDYEKKVAKIPEYLIREALRKAPSKYIACGRNPEKDVLIGDSRVHLRGGAPQQHIIDPITRKRRYATIKDAEDGARLMDALEHIHTLGAPGIGGFGTPQEVPPPVRDLYGWKILFENTEKPVGNWIYNKTSAGYVLKMGAAIVGGEEELRRRPVVVYECECTSPLRYSSTTLETMKEMAEYGLPIMFNPMPMTGATGPITLAGTFVIHNAEVLAGILTAQLINPGTPSVYGVYSETMDMRTCQISFASCEVGLFRAALSQMARYYNLPSCSASGHNDSKLCDAQCGFETGMTLLLSALAGCNIIGQVGMLGPDMGAAYEQVVIGDEFGGAIYRIVQGMEVTDDTLALDIIEKVGIGGHYLSQEHTKKYLRKEHFIPTILDRLDWDIWEGQGAKSLTERAREKAEKILKEHQPEPLDKDVKRELENILKEAENEILEVSNMS